ncbi:TrkH family potassium uptake protein [Bacillaceae bacterium Marseille-Q3522]|nr:TrkH family potassium uptake protein [Bacillaceae bacterium Marseille-Q3522]
MTPTQTIITYYLLAVTVSIILLSLPPVHKPGVDVPFFDTVFTAVSAVSVTGLSVFEISDTYSTFGVYTLMFVLQFGGIGVMTLGTFFWLLLGKKIGLRNRQLIMVDHNQSSLSGLVSLTKEIFTLLLIIELCGAILLGGYFFANGYSWENALIYGLFTSVSATTNGGFSLIVGSLQNFTHDYYVQSIVGILITLGAIGFPILIEVKHYLFRKKSEPAHRFSLFTKLTTLTFAGLFFFGTIFILALEWRGLFSEMSWHRALFNAAFQSVSTRSGGFYTMDFNEFSEPTLILICLLMFIGASPSSVGGGIRTTTFALNILFLSHYARGMNSIKVLKREVYEEDVKKSLAVTMIAMILCFLSVMILSITENFPLIAIIFEVCSAFGTTGLSLGITEELTWIGKTVLMILMFIGRIGLVSFLIMARGKEKPANFHYPKERIIIG